MIQAPFEPFRHASRAVLTSRHSTDFWLSYRAPGRGGRF